jgi:hypothetical protein
MDDDSYELTVCFAREELMEFLEDNETLCLDSEEDREALLTKLLLWMERKSL